MEVEVALDLRLDVRPEVLILVVEIDEVSVDKMEKFIESSEFLRRRPLLRRQMVSILLKNCEWVIWGRHWVWRIIEYWGTVTIIELNLGAAV